LRVFQHPDPNEPVPHCAPEQVTRNLLSVERACRNRHIQLSCWSCKPKSNDHKAVQTKELRAPELNSATEPSRLSCCRSCFPVTPQNSSYVALTIQDAHADAHAFIDWCPDRRHLRAGSPQSAWPHNLVQYPNNCRYGCAQARPPRWGAHTALLAESCPLPLLFVAPGWR
jgi:hypothetical protein